MNWPQKGTSAVACLIGRLWRDKKSAKKAASFFAFYAFFCGNGVFSFLFCLPWSKATEGAGAESRKSLIFMIFSSSVRQEECFFAKGRL